MATHAPLAASHTRAVLSPEAVARCFPSGLNATALTPSECPSSVATHAPLAASHTRAVLSLEAVARCFPSGLNATALTPF